MLTVAVKHPLGRIELDVEFTATHGLTALVGPSGAGKTSILEAIAGLQRPAGGRIALNGDVLVDAAAGLFVPPHRRRVGYVSQEPRLFPHLSVRQNLLYGRWFTPAAQRRIALDDMVGLLDLGALLSRRPARLSGGERQRVALGRALLASPRVLLLDEPLASVDAGKRQDILPYLDRLRADLRLPMLYVTHLFTEISTRAEEALVLDEGRIVARGSPERVRPELERVLGVG